MPTGVTPPGPIVVHETNHGMGLDGRILAVFPAGGPIGAISQLGHLRVLQVAFSAGWNGGDLTVTGRAPDGSTISEVFLSTPGAIVIGNKVFSLLTGASQSGVGVAGHADIEVDTKIGVSMKPISFVKCAVDGVYSAFASTDLINGTFDSVANHNNKAIEVWYTTAWPNG